FILQFLSPKVMRDLRLFSILDDESRTYLEVDSIHDETGYKAIRESLAAQYNLGNREPNIQVYNVNIRGDRMLTLRHYQHEGRPLGKETDELLKHIHRIWQFDVEIESFENGAVTQSWQCSENKKRK
ncbi:SpoVR family protein, partial [Thalassotalea sp. G20_0]